MNIMETDLPGIGKKFQVSARSGDKLVIIVHDDGRRECYHFEHGDPEESISMVTLDDDEARVVAAMIGGMTYKPKTLETIEVALNDLVIEWVKIEADFACVGRSIGEMDIRRNCGATVIALVEPNGAKTINPGPEFLLREDAMLVAAGERAQHKWLKRLLRDGGD
ncbi:MAG: cation:proton antiporter regulatory subunit [Cohnella sp.]|nr:cation:proton antiporter regulatory subunit [Cohnella sp.]